MDVYIRESLWPLESYNDQKLRVASAEVQLEFSRIQFVSHFFLASSGTSYTRLKEIARRTNLTMPMEQAFRHCDKDTLKMAMLKHEETFRQQVHELHRLYRIQKLLMRDLKRELKSQRNLSTSPNGSCTEYNRGALGMCAYEHRYAARGRGRHAAAATPTPRTALSLDVVTPVVEYVRTAEEEDDDEEADETDDDAELELTLAVGGGGTKKRYGEYPSGGESLSSSSTESDVLTVSGREWRQARGTPYHKRRPATGLDVVQVEDGVGVQPPPPLLFHWLSLKMA